ncbi:MAG TPA: P1 family peptidase [Syntrophorhabdus sp.]|jgi:L-aminopeptidase/D-esterase-like protein|nr:P1 family peptidase [Syntrophorhabdus sp.]MDI9558454.1 P1 family peptidase [Pseudomonadota bacterium]OPX95755.1 MAG: Peptidase family S58 [Syntrophorhabdus sp. PtaB.Bin027]OQB78470.1 MAG: Peptidase family S58 [Deltaproteobacteria bacterium ADurb.Bin135]MBP8743884.1 P1 family peptidase [Syntrophorhabdus sp.]
MLNSITDVKGIKVGHASDFKGYTGCTVILCEDGATCGIDIRGSASGTRQVDALGINHIVEHVHAILLSGGSSFGLDAATGVSRYLEEKGVGFDVGPTKIPIVPTAVIFDILFGDPKARPTLELGYEACMNAGDTVEEGSVGVGTGAAVGKIFELSRAMKGGVGTSSVVMPDGLVVASLVVVNAFGDIIDNVTGKIIAGARVAPDSLEFANTVESIKKGAVKKQFGLVNTTLGVVATNAKFNKKEITKVAQIAQGGLIKTINPVHTTFDGDLVFALATGVYEADINLVGVLGEFVIAEAIKRAVKKADGFGIVPAFRDITKGWKTT